MGCVTEKANDVKVYGVSSAHGVTTRVTGLYLIRCSVMDGGIIDRLEKWGY